MSRRRPPAPARPRDARRRRCAPRGARASPWRRHRWPASACVPATAALVVAGELVPGRPADHRARAETFLLEVPVRGELGDLAPGRRSWTWRCCRRGRRIGRPAAAARGPGVPAVRRRRPHRTGRCSPGRPRPWRRPSTASWRRSTASHIRCGRPASGSRGPVGWGQPVVGRVILGVAGPDAELRATAIDISAAGAVLVAGARLDIEALTRARAIGVAGIICGGVVGRELRQLEESDVRQRAALHAITPFAILALDGYGRRPMPTLAWDLLVGRRRGRRQVGVLPDVAGWRSSAATPPRWRCPRGHRTRCASRPARARVEWGASSGSRGRCDAPEACTSPRATSSLDATADAPAAAAARDPRRPGAAWVTCPP